MAKKSDSAAPATIAKLVDTFTEHRETYRRPGYNEQQLRQDFLDPFFEALGWDVNNRQGFAEAYRDVILEQALKVEKSVRAPDYCFRIGGTPKFFVEAKKPAVDVKMDVSPAFQLRRYAWTAKLPLSILTDFEEFAIYDCRVKPDKDDKASTARVLLLPYTEYVERWEEITGIFSRDAILRGSFDKFAESNKKKRGTAEVDAAFLAEIESWREALAKNLSARNEALSDRELNTAVQLVIDRIIFLRMCEGRGIEDYGRLQALLNGERVYARLVEMFHRADEKYNSGLFHFQKEKGRENPDTLTTRLAIDDKVLKEIVRKLYYPESPYEFAALPADILGQVYEQFLGKVIRLTAGHRAKIEEKPEVRKAGGVYYTPTYIVDYIVENTVGKLLEGKTAQEVGGLTATFKPAKNARPLSVLDPACGSGSFLIVAYQYLMDWYLKQYTEVDKPANHSRGANPRIYQSTTGDWRLTIAERKRILLAHIYGVDIDYQACEVTKLSLLLKALEEATKESVERMLFQKERALPDLSKNIKCGNSLVGSDFWQGRQRQFLEDDDRAVEESKINAFDWGGTEGFPEIFAGKSPGFDAVIGNPPYIRMEAFKELKEYLRKNYEVHDERTDLYAYFIEREHKLLREGGLFGMIVSNKFLRANYGKLVRGMLARAARVRQIVDLAGLPVFRGATVRTIVLITQRTNEATDSWYSPPPSVETFRTIQAQTISLREGIKPLCYKLPKSALAGDQWRLVEPRVVALVQKMERNATPLSTYTNDGICRGVVSGLTEAFVISPEQRRDIVRANPAAKEIIYPFLQGRLIRRYFCEKTEEFLIYTPHGIDMKRYPAVVEHLKPFRKQLENRATRQEWYELQQPQVAYKDWFLAPKLIFPDIATGCRFTLDTVGHFGANTVYFIPVDNLALLGLLNSRAAEFYFKQVCAALEGPGEAYLRFFGQYLEDFPVRFPEAPKRRQQFVELVEQMLDLHTRATKTRTGHERTVIERRIEATDREIDRLVYELYGLTEEEIGLVEGATGK
jgi:type I restriction-modification system DNA methylase subunit